MTRCSIAVAVSLMVFAPLGALAQHGRGGGGMGGSVGQGPQGRPESMPRGQAPGHSGPDNGASRNSTRPAMTDADLKRNPALAQKLQPLLPAGMPLDTAASGFKNRGQFIAALHVSKNLGIPFADLKGQMMGPQKQSLGKAIRTLRPEMSPSAATEAERTAQRQAKEDQRTVTSNNPH